MTSWIRRLTPRPVPAPAPAPAPAEVASGAPEVELVVVATDQEAVIDASVRRLHAHLCSAGADPVARRRVALTLVDHASTDGTGARLDALAVELDAAALPVRAVHLVERLDRRSLRRCWASSPAQVAAFVTVWPDTDLDALLAPLAGRVRRPGHAQRGLFSRRSALAAFGGAAGLVVLAACSGKSGVRSAAATTAPSTTGGSSGAGSSSTATSAVASPTTSAASSSSTTATTTLGNVVLAPEMTEGPYYLDLDLVRSDVREDRAGAPLVLDLVVVDVSSMTPLSGAAVDIWHCDAQGLYSGFVAASTGAGGGPGGGGGGGSGTDDSTFLRGTQLTGTDGRVSFTTVYPGWYRGRTVHIHVKVHVSGKEIHTGQLFFDDDYTDTVYASTAPYSSRANRDTRNDDDNIYAGGGDVSTLAVVKSGSGYAASMPMGIKAT